MDRTPDYGARFELLCADTDGPDGQVASVRYAAHVYLPDGRRDLTLEIALPGGTVTVTTVATVDGGAGELPPWAQAHLVALGRQLYREGSKTGVWPRRLMRWRDRSAAAA